jgi:CDP-4-dehydro-6-deoxyglucose reductase
MPRLLTLSRAARLVGVRRGALQGKIRSGELTAFEGMVSADELLRAYPEAKLEDNALLERLEALKEGAFAKRMRERLLPSPEVLLARLALLERYRAIVQELQAKLEEQPDAAALGAWLRERLQPGAHAMQPLLAQESFLRIMTAHVQVRPSGREFLVDGDDTLLEAALRAGLSLDYGCSSGSCGKCRARLVSGEAHRTRHSDYPLTAAEKNAGVLLLCCHTAATDLVIEAREAHGPQDMPRQAIDARVKSVSALGADVRLLHLQTPRSNRLRFLAGQSACLSVGTASAWLPIASCPCDDRNLQFHVRGQVFGGLKSGDTVRIEGPRGEFVLREGSDRPLVFLAGEGGFAPVKSLIEHAMALDTAETIDLCWSAGAGGHYLDNLCRSWGDALDNFRYFPVAAPEALWRVLGDHPRLADCDVYVAGPAPWVHDVEFRLLEQGLPRAQLAASTVDA